MILLVACLPSSRSSPSPPCTLSRQGILRLLSYHVPPSVSLYFGLKARGARNPHVPVDAPPRPFRALAPLLSLSLSRALLRPADAPLDPANGASPRYDSAATLSPWHPLGCRRARRASSSLGDARCHRRSRRYAKRCSLPLLAAAASPAFVRSFARSLGSRECASAPCSSFCRVFTTSASTPWQT